MKNIILPYLMSMILGRTIDLRTYNIGGNVYDDTLYEEIPATSVNASYHVLHDDIFPYDFFGVPADIVLRIKSNYLTSASGAMGLDGLLKDTSWKYNSVIVGVTAIHRTVDYILSENATLLSNWKDKIPKTQTHYADTLFYGGWFVVLFRFKCDIPGDVTAVRKTLTDALGVRGYLGSDIVDLWDKTVATFNANDDIRGKVKVTAQVYSSVPMNHDITSPESLLAAIQEFPQSVGDLGQPLYMSLSPLHELDESYPEVERNEEMLRELEKLDVMMDDVKITKVSLMRWMSETLKIFSDENEERISSLLSKVNDCIRAFNKVNGEVSLFKPVDKDTLEAAFQKYQNGLVKGKGTYYLAYMTLREELDAECDNNFLHKIRGLLKVYDDEKIKVGKVEGGIEECEKKCLEYDSCRAVGYADHVSELDLTTGLYFKEEKQCWIYFRSTSTAEVYTPNGLSGDMGVYDRDCYSR